MLGIGTTESSTLGAWAVSAARLTALCAALLLPGCSADDDKPVVMGRPPAGIEDLAASAVGDTFAVLSWIAPGDDGDTGTAAEYDLRYRAFGLDEDTWDEAVRVPGLPSPLPAGSEESFRLNGLQPETLYGIGIKTADEVPNWSELSNVAVITTAASPDLVPPAPVTDLEAVEIRWSWVELAWTAPGDDGGEGQAAVYDLRYAEGNLEDDWESAIQVEGEPVPGAAGTEERMTVRGLLAETSYSFALRTEDNAGNISLLSNLATVSTPADDDPDAHWWNGFGPPPEGAGLSGGVGALLPYQGELYVGGRFTTPGDPSRSYILRWRGEDWRNVGLGLNGAVRTMLIYNGDLIAAGEFTGAGGTPASIIAIWNGTGWRSLGSRLQGDVHALAVLDGNLYAGGSFRISPDGPEILAARWDGAAWQAVEPAITGSGAPVVHALAAFQGRLVAAGSFSQAGDLSTDNIAAWDGTVWHSLDLGLGGSPASVVHALQPYEGRLLAGGVFISAGPIPVENIAAWDGIEWTALGPGLNAAVRTMAVLGDDLVAGGEFSSSGEVPFSRIARWDGGAWTGFGTGVRGSGEARVEALAVFDQALFVGGVFEMAGGVPSAHVARWDD